MISTAITEMFGIKYPIICGAMMWICKPPICAAVSNAGGLGNLTAGNYDKEDDFRAAIQETRRLTDKPFMVNVTILPSVHITPDHYKMYFRVCAEEKGGGHGGVRRAYRQGRGPRVYRDAQEGRREALP